MASKVLLKRGDDFSMSCTAYEDDEMTVPRDLTGHTVACKMWAPLRTTATLTVTVDNAAAGEFTVSALPAVTELLHPTVWYADIEYTDSGGVVDSTKTFQIEILEDYTV